MKCSEALTRISVLRRIHRAKRAGLTEKCGRSDPMLRRSIQQIRGDAMALMESYRLGEIERSRRI